MFLNPLNHFCQFDDLEYIYGNSGLYKINCKLCNRIWSLRFLPSRQDEDKLIGLWFVSAPYPRPLFPMSDWVKLTSNEFDHPILPCDIAFLENKQRERMIREDNPEFQFRAWKKETGGLKKWLPN